MKRSAHRVRLVFVAIIASLSAAPTFQAQTPDELPRVARELKLKPVALEQYKLFT